MTFSPETERHALEYLSPLMEATAGMLGEHVLGKRGRGAKIMGRRLAEQLRAKGLARYLPDLDAWRITVAGRTAVKGKAAA